MRKDGILKQVFKEIYSAEKEHVWRLLDDGFQLAFRYQVTEWRHLFLEIIKEYEVEREKKIYIVEGLGEIETLKAKQSASMSSEISHVLICKEWPELNGQYFKYEFHVKSGDLPAVHQLVTRVLSFYRFMLYQDLFSSEIMMKIKSVFSNRGPIVAIEATLQVAYWGGVRQNLAKARVCLKEFTHSGTPVKCIDGTNIFYWICNNVNDPGDFLRAAVVYFASQKLELNTTEISKKWKYSRATVRTLLNKAQEMEVERLFNTDQ